MKLVFAGTPEFARASLEALVAAGRTPVAVYTQPDRPAGRGKKLTASPVKQYALQHDIPVYQPQTLRDPAAAAELAALEPDLLIVAAYGLILPQNVLDIRRTVASTCMRRRCRAGVALRRSRPRFWPVTRQPASA